MVEAGAPVETLRALAALAEPPGPRHAGLAAALGLEAPTPADHTALFTFELPPYASVYLGAEGWIGGAARHRIARFWREAGLTPPAEPDHLSALLGLYTGLMEEGGVEGARTLLHEHLAPWAPGVLDLARRLPCGAYRDWAATLRTVLEAELRRAAPAAALPGHLREAPPVADPRTEGADAFLRSLLAHARSGVLLTRTRLAGVARGVGAGLRLGERHFVLKHLLGQDAPGVLQALAQEAEADADAHAARAEWAGPAARHLADRASATARLLRELAAEVAAGDGAPAGGVVG